MGYTNWSSTAYAHLRANYAGKSRDQIFTSNQSRTIAPELNPYGLSFRESRDSEAHPNSLAISVFLDVTGSMGRIPEQLIRHKLGSLMDTLLKHHIQDPQIMFSAIGDHISDSAPLQVGQFESGTSELNDCLARIFLEGGGGGQMMESYLLAWLIAGRHTSIDCFEKRSQKGFLFTIGDEKSWDTVGADSLKKILGYSNAEDISAEDVLAQAQRMYHVFHIHSNETSYRNSSEVIGYWRRLLGERLLILEDHTALAELIASTVAVLHGIDVQTITAGFDRATAHAVKSALANVSTDVITYSDKGVLSL